MNIATTNDVIAGFDIPMLINRANDNGMPLFKGAHILDTYAVAVKYVRGSSDASTNRLSDLVRHFTGTEPEVSHRAMADVEANEVVLRGFLEKLLDITGTHRFLYAELRHSIEVFT